LQTHCYDRTLAALNAHADEDGRTSPTVLEIMRETKQSEATVRRHLQTLRHHRMILADSLCGGRGKRTTYQIYPSASEEKGITKRVSPSERVSLDLVSHAIERVSVQEGKGITAKDTPSSPSSLPPLTLPSILSSSLPPETNINAPTHARSSALNGKVPEWLQLLRELPKWSKNGAPYEKSLLSWAKRKGYSAAVLEASAIGLGTAQEETYNHYTSLKSAFQRRVFKGYDRPASTSNNGYVSATDDVAAHREAAVQDEARAKRRQAERAQKEMM